MPMLQHMHTLVQPRHASNIKRNSANQDLNPLTKIGKIFSNITHISSTQPNALSVSGSSFILNDTFTHVGDISSSRDWNSYFNGPSVNKATLFKGKRSSSFQKKQQEWLTRRTTINTMISNSWDSNWLWNYIPIFLSFWLINMEMKKIYPSLMDKYLRSY